MEFFRNSISSESELYTRIRDYEKDSKVKSQIENFWKKYEPYAPQEYLEKIHSEGNFYQKWWEMFLGVGLLNLNISITTSPKDVGPDFKIILPSQVLWIEAVAPNVGDGVDAIPEFINGINKLPENEFLLRLTTSLDSKLKAYSNYKEKGIVSDNDYRIIAISSCALNPYGSLMDFPAPAPLKVLTGVGNLVLDKKNNYAQYRTEIQKKSASFVETSLFSLESYSKICAVLYSHSDPLNSPDNPETTFQLFFNPFNAPNVNNCLLKVFNDIEIWYQTKNDKYIVWQKHSA